MLNHDHCGSYTIYIAGHNPFKRGHCSGYPRVDLRGYLVRHTCVDILKWRVTDRTLTGH